MHNNIMAAGSRDRPPMLATGRYAQWRSRFLRYIDTRPNGDALRKCILKGPYTPTIVTTPAVPATEDSPAVPEQTTVETVMNMTPENRAHFESEKEAIHLILTGIGDEIYSTVDAFNELRAERMAKNANPLALVATAQTLQDPYYQSSKSHKSYAPTSKASLSTRSHATTRYKGKEIAKPITPPSESASEEDSDPEQAHRDKDMQKNLSLIAKLPKKKASNVFRKEREQYFEIQDLKAQLQDKNIAISELKKLIEKCKGKSVDNKFDNPSVVRQPNAQRIPKPSVLGIPTPFSNSLERKYFAQKRSVLKTNESEGLSKPVTPQNLPQTAKQAVRNTNVIKPGMYQIASSTTQTRAPQLNQTSRNTNPRVSTSTGVAHKTNVSRPRPRSNQMKDKSPCKHYLNSRTSNVNAVCATCGKCVFNSNHDACVSKYLKDVNARSKKPKVVPISASKPKRKTNKSVATPHKKTVASDTTIQNPREELS
ncbi:hypothetical protein Tco_0168277 [Tanacetum coccineum]